VRPADGGGRTLGAIAQLGERLDRTQEVAGSSPASSIASPAQAERLSGSLRDPSAMQEPRSAGALGAEFPYSLAARARYIASQAVQPLIVTLPEPPLKTILPQVR
jgi:hypothetical protein